MEGEDSTASKRQRIVTLTPREHILQRPEMYIGPLAPTEHVVPDFGAQPPTVSTLSASPALISLTNELVTNAVDNLRRDATQKLIRVSCHATEGGASRVIVSNDGSTLPLENGNPDAMVRAFSTFQTGANFDNPEGGKKDALYTAGRNGIGAKGCNCFATQFIVTVGNAQDRKTVTATWSDNMSDEVHVSKATAWARKTNLTTVTWVPDASRLEGTEHLPRIARWLTFNAALCAPTSVKVVWNDAAGDEVIKMRTPADACRAFGAHGPVAIDTVVQNGVEVLRLAVAACADKNDDGEQNSKKEGVTYAFVNATPCSEGSHIKMIHSALVDILDSKANAKRAQAERVHVTPSFLRRHAILVATVLVDNERFTSQTKHCLDTPVGAFGWKWTPSPAFRSAIERSPLLARAIAVAKEKGDADAAKATKTTARRHYSCSKYEPALQRGKDGTTLCVCEGDSAANFVRSGLTVVGRKLFGLYPLRGKFLNVRDAPVKTILDNKEATELLKILGIQLHTTYTTELVRKLPYKRLLVMSDQDVDGSHIAGLIFNFLDAVAPSLLAIQPEFLCRFATSLICVTLPKSKKEELGFYTQREYDEWCATQDPALVRSLKPQFFKGLGTSDAARAKAYFHELKKNTIVVRHTGKKSSDALDLAFHKKRSDDRKTVMAACDPNAVVPYRDDATTLEVFVQQELLPQYAMSSLVRAIPSHDGFKEATRKVFFGARTMRLTASEPLSVANAAGKIAARTHYHHRGTALENTIVGMAQDYTGAANINLLLPLGQFGTRHKHAAAASAYVKTGLNDPLTSLLYPRADDAILEHVVDEGCECEPKLFYPIISMPVVMGAKGIATGWATDVPQHHPLDVVDATLELLRTDDPRRVVLTRPLLPWYRGFDGTVDPDGEGGFLVRGAYKWEGKDLVVTEVPPMREVEAYKEDWAKLEIAQEIVAGQKNSDEKVEIYLKNCSLSPDEDHTKKLGLEKRVTLTNMNLLGPDGKLVHYDRVTDILRAHMVLRLDAYERRLAHLRAECAHKIRVAEMKAAFIGHVLTGAFDVRAHADDASAVRALRALGLGGAEDDASLHQLLDMKMRSLTAERVAALRAEVADLCAARDEMVTRTARGEWEKELEVLRAQLVRDTRYARAA